MKSIVNFSKKNPGSEKIVGSLVGCFRLYLVVALFLAVNITSFAGNASVFTSVANGGWNSTSTWSPSGIPGKFDAVIINGHTITVAINSDAASVTLASAATASSIVMSPAITLNVRGAIVVESPGATNITNLLNVGAGTLYAASLNINGAAGPKNSQLIVNSGVLDVSGDVAFNTQANSILTLAGTGAFKLGGSLASGGTVSASSASTLYLNGLRNTVAQLVPAYTLGNVVVQNSASVKLQKNIAAGEIAGNLTIASGYLDNDGYSMVGMAGKSLTVENLASLRLSGTTGFPSGFSTVDLKPSSEVMYQGGNQTIGALNYGKISLSASGVKTVAGSFSIADNFMINSGVTLDMADYEVSGAGKAFLYGTLKTSHPSGINGVSASFVSPIQLFAGSTVEYNAAVAQHVSARNDYGNIIIANTGEKFLTGSPKFSGTLTINSNAILNLNSSQILSSYKIPMTNNTSEVIVNGTIRTTRKEGFTGTKLTGIHTDMSSHYGVFRVTLNAGSTVDYAAAGSSAEQLVSSRSDYKKIVFSGSMYKALEGSIAVAEKLTVEAGSYLRLEDYQVLEAPGATATAQIDGTVKVMNEFGLANKTNSAFHTNITLLPLSEESNIIYNALTPQFVTAMNYGKLTIDDVEPKTLEGDIIIRNSLTVSEGATLDLAGQQVSPGSWTVARPYIAINGEVRTARVTGLSGTPQTNISDEFVDVWLNPNAVVVYYGVNQYVSGRLDYGTVILEGGPKILKDDAAISGELQLVGSTLALGDKNLSMAPFSIISNTSSTNYIVQNGPGKLIYESLGSGNGGNPSEVLFPIGTPGSYTPAYMTNNGASNNFSILVTDGITDNGGGAVSWGAVNKTWNVHQESTNGSPNITLRLQWNASDELTSFNRSSVAISHYKTGAWAWEGSFVPATGTGPYTATATGITSFSNFGVGNSMGPLPVELVFFKVSKKGESALLEWETATEKNNLGFEIQASADGRSFERIGFVESRNPNSTSNQRYNYSDAQNSKTGLWYYRIKQTDMDGTVAYFGPKVIDFGKARNLVNVYPNPFSDRFEIKVQTVAAADAIITLHDLSGKLVYSATEKLTEGNNRIEVATGEQYPAGLYVLTAKTAGEVYVTRIVKQ